MLAMLDDDRDRVAGLVERREADEERVVALGPGNLCVAHTAGRVALGLADPADLGTARLAGHLDALDLQRHRPCGAARAVHHLVHAPQDDIEGGLVDLDRRRRPRRCVKRPKKMRPDGAGTVAETRRHDRQLQRGRHDIALADAADERLALLPWLLEALALPGGGRDEARPLAGRSISSRSPSPKRRAMPAMASMPTCRARS